MTAREHLQLFITRPYLELHTGPGRGYPVTQVVARGESIDVIMRRTDWYEVRTTRGVDGWVYAADLASTTLADGSHFPVHLGDLAEFADHRWEEGLFLGDYAGASEISAYGALSLTRNLKLDVTAAQYLGNLYNGYLVDAALDHVFLPEKRFSPLVMLGAGYERVQPKATIASPANTTNQYAFVGIGARFYLSHHFFLRGEFRRRDIFTNGNTNEVKTEWKLGFGYFY